MVYYANMTEHMGLNPGFDLSESITNSSLKESPVLLAADRSREQNEELKKNAFIDKLTGIYNQNAWEDFQKHFDQNRGDKATVIIIDLNGLKGVNDREGHSTGDEYIKKTVLYLKSVFSRIDDRVYRIGGDEFGIVCDYVSAEKRDDFNSYILSHFSPDVIGGLGLDFAYGVAHTDIQTDASIKDTIKRADDLMYENKKEIKAANPEKYSR